MLKDREGWCAPVHRDAKSWTQLGDWTTTKWVLEELPPPAPGTASCSRSQAACDWLRLEGALLSSEAEATIFEQQLKNFYSTWIQDTGFGSRTKYPRSLLYEHAQVRCTWANADGTCGIWTNIFFAHSLNCLMFTKALNYIESRIKSF